MQQEVENRDIKRLVHFTPVNNLVNIFQLGLLSISTMKQKGIGYSYNDQERLERQPTATCLSITRPNYSMFFKYRKKYSGTDYAVLEIRKEVLWEKDCAFCIENAASNNVRHIPIHDRKGVNAFRRLFEEYPGKPSRNSLGLSPDLTTHPQAEILVFDDIQPSHIVAVAFEDQNTLNKFRALVPHNIPVSVQKWFYEPRPDFSDWKKQEMEDIWH